MSDISSVDVLSDDACNDEHLSILLVKTVYVPSLLQKYSS